MNASEANTGACPPHLTGGEARCIPFNIENMRAFDIAGNEIGLEIVK